MKQSVKCTSVATPSESNCIGSNAIGHNAIRHLPSGRMLQNATMLDTMPLEVTPSDATTSYAMPLEPKPLDAMHRTQRQWTLHYWMPCHTMDAAPSDQIGPQWHKTQCHWVAAPLDTTTFDAKALNIDMVFV